MNYTATPVVVAGVSGVTALAAGVVHTCALISDGTVKCWGSNDHGELGSTESAEVQRLRQVLDDPDDECPA